MGRPGNGDPGGGELGGGANGTPAQERMALFTLRRPPVMVTFAKAGTASTLLRMVVLRFAVLKAQRERISAAAPETWGVAMDVPLRYVYRPKVMVESTLTPGAPR